MRFSLSKYKESYLGIVLFTLLSTGAFAQVSTSFYNNANQSKLGIAYNINESFWVESRLYSVTSFANLTADIMVAYNFLKRENYNLYAGLGATLSDLQSGLIVPIGTQFFPFSEWRNFSLHIEFQPFYDDSTEDWYIQNFWGFRFRF